MAYSFLVSALNTHEFVLLCDLNFLLLAETVKKDSDAFLLTLTSLSKEMEMEQMEWPLQTFGPEHATIHSEQKEMTLFN